MRRLEASSSEKMQLVSASLLGGNGKWIKVGQLMKEMMGFIGFSYGFQGRSAI